MCYHKEHSHTVGDYNTMDGPGQDHRSPFPCQTFVKNSSTCVGFLLTRHIELHQQQHTTAACADQLADLLQCEAVNVGAVDR